MSSQPCTCGGVMFGDGNAHHPSCAGFGWETPHPQEPSECDALLQAEVARLNACVVRVEAENTSLRAAMEGLLAHCAEQGWWLQSHAIKPMDAARAALNTTQDVE